MRGRVCFVLPSAYGYFADDIEAVGGGARQLSFLSRELTDAFDVHFVVGDYGQPRREVYDGVTLHRAYEQSPDAPPWRKPVQFAGLFRAMQRADADIYLYRGRPILATATYLVARSLRARWVYNLGNDSNVESDPDALPRPVRALFGRALADSDAVITQTDPQADKLRARFDVSSVVVPSGYPPADSILPHEQRESILWVGRLDRDQKRPHLFLDVAEAVRDASFDLVGPDGQDPSYNERIRDRATSLENVTYHGGVDPAVVHDYYRRAVALVNTSAYEGFPSTFLEAWRYETPVVSLDVPVTRYTDFDAYEGDAEGELDRLVAIVSRLASDPSFRRTLADPTTQYFRNHLTIEQVADRYVDVLRRVLDD